MTTHPTHQPRQLLDQIFFTNAIVSLTFGSFTLLIPHKLVAYLSPQHTYNHSTHETLRLLAAVHLAVGRILLGVRQVDDGRFRRSVCEALGVMHGLQALVVLRAQLTNSADSWLKSGAWNWTAIAISIGFVTVYTRFRFGKGGELIKVYELPSNSTKAAR